MHHSSNGLLSKSRWGDLVCLALLAVAVFLLFKTSPTQGDFWWSDAPRHAMDGAFYYDMARALPIHHLKQWAIDYYLQYPAVTALTYPPLFALVEAWFFSVFGVSHVAAQLTVAFFLLLTAFGAYFLARRWMGRIAAFATGLLFIGTPVMALWGRQVMLEIPTFAFLLWSCYFFFRYLDSNQSRHLLLVIVLVLAAADTKQPAVFILPAFLLTLYFVQGNGMFRRAEFWWSAGVFAVGIAPLVLYTWLWGRANMQQAVGGGWIKHSRLSLATWSYVAGFEWPRQLGWAVLALALIYVCRMHHSQTMAIVERGFIFPVCLAGDGLCVLHAHFRSFPALYDLSNLPAGSLFGCCNRPRSAAQNSAVYCRGVRGGYLCLYFGNETCPVHIGIPHGCSVRMFDGVTRQHSYVLRDSRRLIHI